MDDRTAQQDPRPNYFAARPPVLLSLPLSLSVTIHITSRFCWCRWAIYLPQPCVSSRSERKIEPKHLWDGTPLSDHFVRYLCKDRPEEYTRKEYKCIWKFCYHSKNKTNHLLQQVDLSSTMISRTHLTIWKKRMSGKLKRLRLSRI